MHSGLSWEVLKRHARQQLSPYPGWIITGVAGPLLLTIWLLIRPFYIRDAIQDFFYTVVYLIVWYVAFTTVWAVFHWLKPLRIEQDPGLDAAPLSALQYFLHRCAGLCTVPLLTMALTLPLFLVLLVYTGDPYGSGSNSIEYVMRANYEWAEFPNPWGLRMLFVFLNLSAATLIPLMLAVAMQETVAWRPLRIILQLVFPPLLWYVVRSAEQDYVRTCYKQTLGHDPLGYLVIGLLLLLLPFLLGWLRRRGRLVLAAVLFILAAAVAVLPFLAAEPQAWVSQLRDILGDTRFALAYYAGHLQPVLNAFLLFDSYESSVLLNDHTAGNLIPQRVAIWVGAGLYPVLLPVVSFLLLGLGITLSQRHPTE